MSTVQLLSPRILALPADVRRTLAGVDGPGWVVRPPWTDGAPPTTETIAVRPDMRWLPVGSAFWSANPAASVAAVLYQPGSPLHSRGLYLAHELLRVRLVDGGDDHAAALSIIEGYVADRGTNG